MLEQLDLYNSQQLSGVLPNFKVNSGESRSFGDLYTLRGLTNTPFFSEPSVIYYLDGVPLGNAFSYYSTFLDISKAELFRGPQGAFFGKNSEGGIVRITTPTPGESKASSIKLRAGNHGSLRGQAHLETPIANKKIFLALSGFYSERDGWTENTSLGTHPDFKESLMGRLKLRLPLSETTEISWQSLVEETDDGGQAFTPLGNEPYRTATTFDGETKLSSQLHTLQASHKAEAFSIQSTTAFRDWELSPFSTQLVIPPTIDNFLTQDQQQWSQEIRLGTTESETKLEGETGLYFENRKTSGQVERLSPFFNEESRFDLEKETVALFGNGTYQVNNQTALTLGLRAEKTSASINRVESIPTPSQIQQDQDFSAFLPSVGLRHQWNAHTESYLRLAEGYKPGGFSAYTGNADFIPFGKERVTSYEAGLKRLFPSLQLEGRINLFFYDIKDYQIERTFTDTDYYVINVPEAESAGGEIDLAWKPWKGVAVNFGLGYTDIHFEDYTDPTGTNYSGNQAPFAPEFDLFLSLEYEHRSGWFIWTGLQATGKTFYEESNARAFQENGYTLLNAGLGYKKEGFSLRLFGKNLTDERYYSLINPGIRHGVHGAPRILGMEWSLSL